MSSPEDPEHTAPDALGGQGGGTPAEQVERALGTLEGLSAILGDVDKLKDTVAELIVDNRRLRGDNVRLARALVNRSDGGADVLEALKAAQEKARIAQQQVQDLLEENTDVSSRLFELEELNSSMMSMYISSYQLHATLDLDEVVRVIEEIIVNFVGAAAYAILSAEDDGTFSVTASSELGGRLPERGIEPRGVLAEVIGSGAAYVHTTSRAAREGILAAVPLAMGRTTVGAVLIFKLFDQKDRLLRNDVELLSLLGGHAASAVVSAKLYARADRKLKTLEGMIELLGSNGD
jgi:regulator of replication initiation timing